MGSITEILNRAKLRANEMDLPYEGALLPTEALTFLQENSGARLVDVRSKAEWSWVGRIPGAVEIEWLVFPSMQANPDFLEHLSLKVPKESPVMFICRSGVRSNQAAIAALESGYVNCFNVLEGFEGDKDSNGHRGVQGGWKAAGLPWVQS
ncbi:MAG: rhodanese-like domain-containing protein [Nitrosomonadaceae bacterium]|jgi:rhodanese-related sulfurtransferase|nr:rhodanese-like domain-containing protein [Nitrosomonadaceae bacterium]